MTGTRVPLSVLDLVPVASGASAAHAVHNSIDLARRAETLGYGRYWFAEHHLNQGVAGTAPTVMIGLAAAATRTIRVGSAGVQLGHRTPLSVVEEFGLLDCAYPGPAGSGPGPHPGHASPPARRRHGWRSARQSVTSTPRRRPDHRRRRHPRPTLARAAPALAPHGPGPGACSSSRTPLPLVTTNRSVTCWHCSAASIDPHSASRPT